MVRHDTPWHTPCVTSPTNLRPDHPCLVCGKTDREKAMAFRGEDWCCELHRKQIVAAREVSIEAIGYDVGGSYSSQG